MLSKTNFEDMEYIIRHIDPLKSNHCFGGKLILFGGDWHQTLPILKHANDAQIFQQTIKSSRIFPNLIQITLGGNMRLNNIHNLRMNNWRQLLNNISNGVGNQGIQLPSDLVIQSRELDELIDFVFPQLNQLQNFNNCAILTPKNEDVLYINNMIISKLPGETINYYSVDDLDASCRQNIPQEYMNSLNISGIPPHALQLKLNIPVMLLRNFSPAKGLSNGTICKVLNMRPNVIQVEILTGRFMGDVHLIPRITFISSYRDFPFIFRRHQFPLMVCFAMTINKSQGQTMLKVGAYLKNEVFSHGQLYVAASRVRSPDDIKFILPQSSIGNVVRNVVINAVLH